MCKEVKERMRTEDDEEGDGSDVIREETFDERKYEAICAAFERAFKDGQSPYHGDLENELYKAILQRLRSY